MRALPVNTKRVANASIAKLASTLRRAELPSVPLVHLGNSKMPWENLNAKTVLKDVLRKTLGRVPVKIALPADMH